MSAKLPDALANSRAGYAIGRHGEIVAQVEIQGDRDGAAIILLKVEVVSLIFSRLMNSISNCWRYIPMTRSVGVTSHLRQLQRCLKLRV
jgi:hypothetical protein